MYIYIYIHTYIAFLCGGVEASQAKHNMYLKILHRQIDNMLIVIGMGRVTFRLCNSTHANHYQP